MEIYNTKGFIKYYFITENGTSKLSSSVQTKSCYKENIIKMFGNNYEKIEEDIINEIIEKEFNLFIYDLIPGLDFLEMVKNKSIINYDGVIDCILVNGYKTNLGLITKNGFIDGEFLVDETTFKALCDGNEVLVNWANK